MAELMLLKLGLGKWIGILGISQNGVLGIGKMEYLWLWLYNEDMLCHKNVNKLQSYYMYENNTMNKCYCVFEE